MTETNTTASKTELLTQTPVKRYRTVARLSRYNALLQKEHKLESLFLADFQHQTKESAAHLKKGSMTIALVGEFGGVSQSMLLFSK